MVTGNIFRAKVVTNKKLDKYLAILKIGNNIENHDDGKMKKKLNFWKKLTDFNEIDSKRSSRRCI